MNKKIIVVLLFAVFFAVFIYSFNHKAQTDSVCIEGKKCFKIEIADDDAERNLGLSYRDSLDQDGGMFFVFESEGIKGFWMRGMRFPLDIIWINENKEIIGIEKDIPICETEPCEIYYPESDIKYVLEINGGLSDVFGFESGDVIQLK